MRTVSIAILAALSVAPAIAQPKCAPHDVMVQALAMKYGETRQTIGLAVNGSIVETYASTDTGTWSIIVTMPDGRSCLVSSGQSFENTHELPEAGGEPT